jgi:transcriptional regulator with XRE-family HTH domain
MQHARRGRKESELAFDTSGANSLGEAVRSWRHHRGLTVTELAILAGFGTSGRSYISKVEHGAIRRLGAARLRAIAESLQIRLEDLLPRAIESDVAIDAWAAVDQALSSQALSQPQSGIQPDNPARSPFFPPLQLSRELLTGGMLSADIEQMIDGFLLQLESSCQAQIHRFLQENLRARLIALVQQVAANASPARDAEPHGPQPLPAMPDPQAEESSCSF